MPERSCVVPPLKVGQVPDSQAPQRIAGTPRHGRHPFGMIYECSRGWCVEIISQFSCHSKTNR